MIWYLLMVNPMARAAKVAVSQRQQALLVIGKAAAVDKEEMMTKLP